MERNSVQDLLLTFEITDGLSREDIDWLTGIGRDTIFDRGDVIFREGDEARDMLIILEGETQYRRESLGAATPTFSGEPGHVTGLLPFSRMKLYSGTTRAVLPSRILLIDKMHFPEIQLRLPHFVQRLVGLMSDRIREATRLEQQVDKLTALGKLSAGLAHELNNPAAAIGRSAGLLKEMMASLREASSQLAVHDLSPAEKQAILEFEGTVAADASEQTVLDPLALSAREENLTVFLETKGVAEGWKFAGTFAEAGLEERHLESLAGKIQAEALPSVFAKLAAFLQADQLVREIETASNRISDIVASIKEYSYLDQAPIQEIDIHDGIEATLSMFRHRLSDGITVVREYNRSIPTIEAYGPELNQVWTHLIDNALDAMGKRGTLQIFTCRDNDCVVVEIVDDGPGIPDALRDRVFDPFFTTKPVGAGTGLGLDTVHRIVRKHGGNVQCQSRPGDTRFCVRLPIDLTRNKM